MRNHDYSIHTPPESAPESGERVEGDLPAHSFQLRLLARLGGRSSLREIEPCLCADEDSPPHGDILEFHGPEGTGKTEMLYHVAARCILPRADGGLEADVLFIDTDCRFDLLRLVAILERRLSGGSEEAVTRCLARLLVAQCHSSAQVLLTLHSLGAVLCSRPALCLLAVDSLSAFYWLDRASGGESPRAQEATLAQCAQVLQRLVREHRLLLLATTQSVMRRAPASARAPGAAADYRPYLCRAWQDAVRRRLFFSKQGGPPGSPQFSVVWRHSGSSALKKRGFVIGESGVQFQ
ncbi:PREDICTED: DNA repair protein XRCC2 [Condylura cristata]|uniref:DNA repair protein XRCC2 n=1 Tax=Condylura cristata TaxID=143302 RepID=UPI000642CC9A|nr:PREDICTED: DNA repair protein XRCC2 [Condylura cristata]